MASASSPYIFAPHQQVPVNEISWFCAHNAFNSKAEIGGLSDFNQTLTLAQLLGAGVRAFMIDVHCRPLYDEAKVAHFTAHSANKDLADVLAGFKTWLDSNPYEVILLLMETDGRVSPLKVKQAFDSTLLSLLYTHPGPGTAWPSWEALVNTHRKRVIVFRETDDGKGRIEPTGMDWYHDMWQYWIETPYSTTKWSTLQDATYRTSFERGRHNAAAFFNLNHFDQYNVINEASYLKARTLVAWKMQARRPTVSLDFVQLSGELNDDKLPVGGATTVQELNDIKTLSGTITDANHRPVVFDIQWDGVQRTKLADHCNSRIIQQNDGPPAGVLPTSRGGYYCFPSDGAGNKMTLEPRATGYEIRLNPRQGAWPSKIEWDGRTNEIVNFVAQPLESVVQVNNTDYQIRLSGKENIYIADCHQTAAGGTYYGWSQGPACKHGFATAAARTGHLHAGDTVYIQSGQSGMKGYVYLSAGTQYNLSYTQNKQSWEEWIVERVDTSRSGDIEKGEKVRFRSAEQTRQRSVNAYLSVETDSYLGTRSLSESASDYVGMEWIIE